jgi:hypothetical protein
MMRREHEGRPPGSRPPVPQPETPDELEQTLASTLPEPQAQEPLRPGRIHLVVVTTRAVSPQDTAPPGSRLVTRFWHPRYRRWAQNTFESLEHAVHLFVDESGWTLRQQQALDEPSAHELIFEARRVDFTRPSTEEMLEDVGLSREEVANFLERFDRDEQQRRENQG